MPLYDFECDGCGDVVERFYHIGDCPGNVKCETPGCMGLQKKTICYNPPAAQIWKERLIPNLADANDPDGKWVTSKKQHKQIMAEQNLAQD